MSLLNQIFKSKTEKDAGIKSPCEKGFTGSLILEKVWPLVVKSKTKPQATVMKLAVSISNMSTADKNAKGKL